MKDLKIICNICGALNFFETENFNIGNDREFECRKCQAHIFELEEVDE